MNVRLKEGLKKLTANVGCLAVTLAPIQVSATVELPADFRLSAVDWSTDSTRMTPMPNIDLQQIEASMWELQYLAYENGERYDSAKYRLDDLLNALDYDGEAAFIWVRDNIRFEPYAGILRDVDGTLGGRAANDYDRSLLLKKLLEDMGYEARLAYGPLDAGYVDRLRSRSLEPDGATDSLVPLAQAAGFSEGLTQRMLDRSRRDYQWLTRVLGDLPDGAAVPGFAPSLLDAHVWVQAKLEGDWTDLDTTFGDAQPGDVFAKAERFANEPAEADRQVVNVRLVAETLHNGELVEQRLLDHTMDAAASTRARTYLVFAPMNPTTGGVLAEKLGVEKNYVPMLVVDGTNIKGERVPGVVGDLSENKEFFYGKDRAELSALYVDVQVGLPGSLHSGSRGVLLDRLDASARLQGAPAQSALKPLSVHEDQPEIFRGFQQILVSNGGANPRTVSIDVGLALYFIGRYLLQDNALDELPFDSVMWPTAMFRNAQLALNERLLMAALNDRPDIRLFFAEPRVYLMGHTVHSVGDQTRIGMSVDLLHDPIQAIVASQDALDGLIDRRMWHGVLQSSFENALVEQTRVTEPGNPDSMRSASTQSRGEGVRLTDPRDRRLPADATRSAVDDLLDGKIVVASATALQGGLETWWSVGPDGRTRAMLAPAKGGSYMWWEGYFNNPRLPKQSLFSRPVDIGPQEKWDRYAREAAERYRGEAARRTQNRAPKTQRNRGGGLEYNIVMEISLYNAIGVTGILGLTIVGLALGGALYMVGYVYINERQRRERGY